MRDEQVRVENSNAELHVFGRVAILRELLRTGWMSRMSKRNHIDELYMYMQGRYAR